MDYWTFDSLNIKFMTQIYLKFALYVTSNTLLEITRIPRPVIEMLLSFVGKSPDISLAKDVSESTCNFDKT